jgi:hypothetical protein
VPVALEVQHHVHQVLQHPGAGDRSVLGDVADQHAGDAALLGGGRQCRRDRPHLGDPAGRSLHPSIRDGLHRVHDQQPGLHLLDVRHDRGQLGLRRQVEIRMHRAQPLGP